MDYNIYKYNGYRINNIAVQYQITNETLTAYYYIMIYQGKI